MHMPHDLMKHVLCVYQCVPWWMPAPCLARQSLNSPGARSIKNSNWSLDIWTSDKRLGLGMGTWKRTYLQNKTYFYTGYHEITQISRCFYVSAVMTREYLIKLSFCPESSAGWRKRDWGSHHAQKASHDSSDCFVLRDTSRWNGSTSWHSKAPFVCPAG